MDPAAENTNKRAASPFPEKDATAEGGEAASKRQAVEEPSTGEPKPAAEGAEGGGEAKPAAGEDAAPAQATNIDTETVIVRAIVLSAHTGTIIGKGGATISWIRTQSQAKVNISDADRSQQIDERIVTVTGTCAAVFRAFSFICDKIRESQQQQAQTTPNADAATVTIRLAIPNIQAGAIIGKKGAKIKEIRDATQANINVETDMLPNSTERCCIVSGSVEPVAQSIFHIACTLLQVPAKGHTQPYNPGGGGGFQGGGNRGGYQGGGQQQQMGGYGGQGGFQQQGFPQPGGYGGQRGPGGYGGGGGGGQPGYGAPQIQQSLNVSNEVVGAIIGRAGSKINEIRQTSGAQVKIADKVPGAVERTIIMSGTPEAVQMAQYLIQTRMQEAMMAQMSGGQVS